MTFNLRSLSILFLTACVGCKKFVEIQPPVDSITTSQVFADSTDASAAVLGIYSKLGYTDQSFANSLISLNVGLSSDELLPFAGSIDQNNMSTNTITFGNGKTAEFWIQGYSYLYQPNAVIEGLQGSTDIPQNAKEEFIGEAKWFRAFINFYLLNLFGNISLITSSDYHANSLQSQTSPSNVYQSIIIDLKDAQNLLLTDYSTSGGERTRVNKWAATALLARTYLYVDSFSNAEAQATSVINYSSLFTLDTLNGVFLKNSSEAILQWYNSSTDNTNTYNATSEGNQLIPFDSTSPPNYYLSNQLLNGFEEGDLRRVAWVDSTDYNGIIYYYPFKYKVGPAEESANAPVTEYYTVLRLAEQYLIRAEARAQQNNLFGAISDLNVIRNRAGLTSLPPSLSQPQILTAIAQERRIELFSEWGHRWLDLKRTGQVSNAFSTISYKSAYQPFQQLYPIPVDELQNDPNLKQNPGY
jgi:starch-binding outer membrane protein, SusD/RagB family